MSPPLMNIQMAHPNKLPPMSMYKSIPSSNISSNTSFTFEPSPHHNHSQGTSKSEQQQHSTSTTPSTSMSLQSNSSKIMFRNSDDLLLHPSCPIEPSGTFPRKKEPQRIRIPSNQSVTSRSSTERFELRNSPMPTYHIEVSFMFHFSFKTHFCPISISMMLLVFQKNVVS